MKLSTHGSVAAVVLATTLGLSLAGPHRAQAAPKPFAATPSNTDLGVSILSPDPNITLAGLKPVEISAFYQGSPANQIVALELFIDGAKAATKTLDVPETRGVVSFLINASQITTGRHKVVVRATAADQEVISARTSFTFGADDASTNDLSNTLAVPSRPAATSELAPTLHLITPTLDGKVQGVVTLHVVATDPSGKPPYVSLFIDKAFKTLRNYAPYDFEWDTTAYSNGYHTIEAFGYNDSPNVGHARAMRLFVNNPGGETGIRHDLLDALKPATPKPSSKSVASKPTVPKPLATRPVKTLKSASTEPKKRTKLANAQVATLLPMRPQSTQEIVRQLATGAGAVHFGSLDYATELSSPFVADQPTAAKFVSAKPIVTKPIATKPMAFKPMPVKPVQLAKSQAYKSDLDKLLAGMPALRAVTVDKPHARTTDTIGEASTISQATRIAKSAFQQMASLHLPNEELVAPFVTVPHIALIMPAVSSPTPQVQIHATPSLQSPKVPHLKLWVPTLKLPTPSVQMYAAPPAHLLKMQPLRVHLPASLGSLLRSVGQTSLQFNHTTVTMDRPLADRNSVLFGPLRQIFEQGGGTLTWESRTGTVHAKSATKNILLTVGSQQAIVNAKPVTLDGKPYLLMGRTMVPVSFIAAAMDADVQFDAATGHLLVTSRK